MSDLVNGQYPVKYLEWLLNGAPTGLRRQNIRRHDAISDTAALTTAVMTSVALPLEQGDVVTSLTFKSGATAAGTPTHWWFALYDPSGNLLAQTADQTSTAWAADTTKTLALASQVNITAPGVYYAAVCVVATTPPSLAGVTLGRAAMSTGIFAADKVLAQTSGSALVGTAPATIATPTAIAAVPIVVAT